MPLIPRLVRTLALALVPVVSGLLVGVATTAGPAQADPADGTLVYQAQFHAETFYNWKAEYSDTEFQRRVLELNVDGFVLGATFINGTFVSSREGTNVFSSISSFRETVTNEGDTRTYCPDDDDVRDPTGFEPRLRTLPTGTLVLEPFYGLTSRLTCTTKEGSTTSDPFPGSLSVPGITVPVKGLADHLGEQSFRLPLRGVVPDADCPGRGESDVTLCYFAVEGHVDLTLTGDTTHDYDKPTRPRVEKKGRRASVQVGCQVDCRVEVEARPLRGSGKPYASTRTRLPAGASGIGTLGLSAAEARAVCRDGGLRLVVTYTSDDAGPRTYRLVARV